PAAVTAVQLAAGGLVALPIALLTGGAPPAPAGAGPVLVLVALSVIGTLAPFWLFALGQSRVTPDVAGAFANLEPLVGAAIGWLAFGDAAAPQQIVGALAVLAGMLLGTVPRRRESPGESRERDECGRHRHAVPRDPDAAALQSKRAWRDARRTRG